MVTKQMGRVYGPDLMLEVCRISVKRKFTHFLYGGNVWGGGKIEGESGKAVSRDCDCRDVYAAFPPLECPREDELKSRVAAAGRICFG